MSRIAHTGMRLAGMLLAFALCCRPGSMIKALILLLLAGIILSLFSGLFFLNQDQGNSRRMVRALTVRITLSVILFLVLIYAWFNGLIQPHGVGPG